jgi:hypothetical protein
MALAGDPVDTGVTASPAEFAAAVAAALGPADDGRDPRAADAGAGLGYDRESATSPRSGAATGVGSAADAGVASGADDGVASGADIGAGSGADIGTEPGADTGAADALVAVFVPPVATPGDAYARAIREVAADVEKPVVAVFFAAEGVPAELAVLGRDGTPVRGSVPSYASPERAAAALARVSRYARWRAAPAGDFTPPPGIDGDAARDLVARWEVDAVRNGDGAVPSVPDGGQVLADDDAAALLACYGITLVESRRAGDANATVAAAEELGYPVAVKAVGDRWRHRTDQIGVRLDVVTPPGARRAYADLAQLSGHDEVEVQRMAPKGVACVLEIVEDRSFGSLIAFGLAGTATELLGDRAFRVVPVSDHDAAALVRAPRAAPLLDGYRGAEPTDLAAMEDLVRRVGKLAEDLPQVRALTLEPVLATPTGVWVVGARAVVGPPPRRDDTGPRRMR